MVLHGRVDRRRTADDGGDRLLDLLGAGVLGQEPTLPLAARARPSGSWSPTTSAWSAGAQLAAQQLGPLAHPGQAVPDWL
jgi:hypothetical protein